MKSGSGQLTKTLSLLNDERLAELKNLVLNAAHEYTEHYLKIENRFKIISSWALKTQPEEIAGFGEFHNHGNCVLSASYYFDRTSESGGISFKRPMTNPLLAHNFEFEIIEDNPENVQSVNVEPETEQPTMDTSESTNEEPVVEADTDSEQNEPTEEVEQTKPDSEATEESTMEDESSDEQESVQQKEEQEPAQEPIEKPKQEEKQKAATKIIKKMGDKGRYEANNQIKTLIVMQVLANSKSFFVDTQLSEIQGFFTDVELPDTTISDNNIANYFMTIDSDNTFNQIVDSQYNR